MAEPDILRSSFYIQNIELKGRVLLAPMDGYTDAPFRMLCQKFGSSLNTSEFINGIDVVHGHPFLKFHTYFEKNERPFSYQIFDDNPDRLLKAALILEKKAPDLIDVNMGCSARNVSNRGAGAGLLKDTRKITEITKLLISHLRIPITAKIRLGWDENSRNYLEISRILQDNGVSAITVHARTRQQEYTGIADWNAIAEIKHNVHIPIIGNGDVKSLEDARRLIIQTGCDAVMIGRAAIGNPWVFTGLKKDSLPLSSFLSVIHDHLQSMCALYTPKIGTILFRKHLSKYMQSHLSVASAEFRRFIFSIEDPKELEETISRLYYEKGSIE